MLVQQYYLGEYKGLFGLRPSSQSRGKGDAKTAAAVLLAALLARWDVGNELLALWSHRGARQVRHPTKRLSKLWRGICGREPNAS